MSKSQAQTDAEILAGAKRGDVIVPEGMSLITRRHTRSVHPVQCNCDLCIDRRFKPFSPIGEAKKKEELDWYQGES